MVSKRLVPAFEALSGGLDRTSSNEGLRTTLTSQGLESPSATLLLGMMQICFYHAHLTSWTTAFGSLGFQEDLGDSPLRWMYNNLSQRLVEFRK